MLYKPWFRTQQRLALVDLGLVFSGVTAVAVASGTIVALYQLSKIEQQEQLEVFDNYTKRYSEIVDALPDDVYIEEKSMFESVRKGSLAYDNLMKSMRKFFNLCSEEYYLYHGTTKGEKKSKTAWFGLKSIKKIDDGVWELWKQGIEYHMRKETFRMGWFRVKNEGYNEGFQAFINEMIPADERVQQES
jgi:hypothetical protein